MTISPGETVLHHRVWYKGQVCVNLIGTWGKGFSEPLWIMTNLEAQQGQRIYFARMKIDETFRDLKSLLGMTKLMNKQKPIMEKMLARLLLVFAIGRLIGEGLRDHLYGKTLREQEVVPEKDRLAGSPQRKKGKKWRRYSGLFILLKQQGSVSACDWQTIVASAVASFIAIVRHPVPTHV